MQIKLINLIEIGLTPAFCWQTSQIVAMCSSQARHDTIPSDKPFVICSWNWLWCKKITKYSQL